MKSIAICSGKGSPGATFVSINLAHAAAGLGKRKLLIDLDRHGGDVAGYLGLDPRKGLYPLGLLGRGEYSAEALRGEIEERGGIRCIAGFPKPSTIQPELLKQIFSAASDADGLLVADLGRVDGLAADVAAGSDQVIVVVRPDLISTHGAQRAKETLLESGVPEDRLSLVINGWEWRRTGDVAEVAEAIGLPSVGMIPLVRRAARKALQAQLPIQKGRAVKAFRDVASRLTVAGAQVQVEAEVAVA